MTSRADSNIFHRLVIASSVSMALVISSLSPFALAADVNGSNGNTGSGSSNSNEVNQDSRTNVSSNNNTTTSNQYSLNLNTGKNTAKDNTNLNGLSTGNVGFSVGTTNNANNGGPSISGSAQNSGNVNTSNNNTGYDSRNRNIVNQENSTHYSENNSSRITNILDINVNTGKNLIDHNTNASGYHTGNIQVDIDVRNNTNNHGPVSKPNEGNPNLPGTHTQPQTPTSSPSPITLMPIGGKGGGGFVPAGGDSLPYVVGLAMLLIVGGVTRKKMLAH